MSENEDTRPEVWWHEGGNIVRRMGGWVGGGEGGGGGSEGYGDGDGRCEGGERSERKSIAMENVGERG